MPVRIEQLDVVPQPQPPGEQKPPPPTADVPSPRLAEEIDLEIAMLRARELRLRVT